MTEQIIQNKMIRYLEARGHYVVKVIQANKSGIPDLLVCINGRFVGLEVKKPNTIQNTSKLQVYNLTKINESGGRGYVVSSLRDLEKILQELSNV